MRKPSNPNRIDSRKEWMKITPIRDGYSINEKELYTTKQNIWVYYPEGKMGVKNEM